MKQTRHASNLLYRQVADQLGLETLQAAQADTTGAHVSMNTVKRYYSGYGTSPIPTPGFEAALRLTNASFAANRILINELQNQHRTTTTRSRRSSK